MQVYPVKSEGLSTFPPPFQRPLLLLLLEIVCACSRSYVEPNIAAHPCNPSTLKAEAKDLQVPGHSGIPSKFQLGLQSKTLSPKEKPWKEHCSLHLWAFLQSHL